MTASVTINDAELSEALARLSRYGAGGLIQAALKNIGQQMLKATRARMVAETAPDGARWAPLNPDYAASKRGPGILRESGMRGGLMSSITASVAGNAVRIGTNKVQAGIHQFGGEIRPRSAAALAFTLGGRLVLAQKVTIPARPFLGISADDRAEIRQVIEDHIDMVLNR